MLTNSCYLLSLKLIWVLLPFHNKLNRALKGNRGDLACLFLRITFLLEEKPKTKNPEVEADCYRHVLVHVGGGDECGVCTPTTVFRME